MIYMWIFQTYFPALLEVYEFRLLQASLQLETITEWSHSGCDSRSLQVIGRVIVLYLLMEAHFKATKYHLPYGIKQCYLPPDTNKRAPS